MGLENASGMLLILKGKNYCEVCFTSKVISISKVFKHDWRMMNEFSISL